MPEVITGPEQATPAWLTQVLREAGLLDRGEVTGAYRRSNAAFNSSIVHLELTYSDEASELAPQRAVLKLNRNHDGAVEASFYALAAGMAEPVPALVRCYAAGYAQERGDSFCLLEDVSATHRPPVTREQLLAGNGVPSAAHLDQIVDALARFHAYWWEHPCLGTIPDVTEIRPWYRDKAHYERHIERREREWAAFIGAVGDWFPADLRRLYEDVLAQLPGLWEAYLERRVTTFRHMTLANGDCYLTQFLCPNDPAAGTAYMIDFQDMSANFGAYDLAYLFPTFWTPAERQEERREEQLLRRYHQTLQANGVDEYAWEDLLADYRLMITLMLFDPVWNQTSGAARSYWWPKLECLAGAYRDLDCRELLP